jgi:hypothetical protein
MHFIIDSHLTRQFTYTPCFSLSYKPSKHPVRKRKDPPKVCSQEAIKLCKKKKEELSDPPYVPPEDVCITKSKNNLKHSGKKSVDNAEPGEEDGVVGALDDVEQE